MKHTISISTMRNGAISVKSGNNDTGIFENGDVIALNWQPNAGWGLQNAFYTTATDPDTKVPIDLTTRVFTMPDDDITIGGTFKKFSVGDWTTGTAASDNAGKFLGFDNEGNIVPMEGGGGSGSIEGSSGDGKTPGAIILWGSDGNQYEITTDGKDILLTEVKE